jgi:hypothetical protein
LPSFFFNDNGEYSCNAGDGGIKRATASIVSSREGRNLVQLSYCCVVKVKVSLTRAAFISLLIRFKLPA